MGTANVRGQAYHSLIVVNSYETRKLGLNSQPFDYPPDPPVCGCAVRCTDIQPGLMAQPSSPLESSTLKQVLWSPSPGVATNWASRTQNMRRRFRTLNNVYLTENGRLMATNDNPTCTNCKYFSTANSTVEWKGSCNITLPPWVAHHGLKVNVVRADSYCDLFQQRNLDREIPQHVQFVPV